MNHYSIFVADKPKPFLKFIDETNQEAIFLG